MRASTWVPLMPCFGEGGGDHDAGKALAEADDVVGGARGEFADGGDAAEQVVEGVEVVVDVELRATVRRSPESEFAGGFEVAGAEACR